jgi:hypothetical protein
MWKWLVRLWKGFKPTPKPNCRIVRVGDTFWPQRLLPRYRRLGLSGDLEWMCYENNDFHTGWDKTTPGKYPRLYTHFNTYEEAADWLFKHLAKEEYETPQVVMEFRAEKKLGL